MKKVFTAALLFVTLAASAQPTIWGGAKLKLQQGDTSFVASLGAVKSWLGLSGGGTVSSFSSGNLSPLFTTSVSDPNTTPALSFSLSNAGANTYFGNSTGSSAAPSFTAAGALTKVDDTNVTLTLGGNASTSLLRAASITVGWTGTLAAGRGGTGNAFTQFSGPASSIKTFTLPNASATILTDNAAVTAAQGGTGQTTYTTGDLLQATGTTTLSKLAAVATGNVLISGGVGTASSWGKVGLGTHVSGTLAVANGGTGLTAVGGDPTLLGSNGSANVYFTPAVTNTAAAIAFSRSGSTLNLNVPDADASNRGTVSTGTQTFAGAKTFNGLVTGSGGIKGTAGASQAAIEEDGVTDRKHTVITANTTLDHTYNLVAIGTLSGDITITLPNCTGAVDGWTYTFTKLGTDSFAFILDPHSTQTFFDGATTKTYYSQGNQATCTCRTSDNTWYLQR